MVDGKSESENEEEDFDDASRQRPVSSLYLTLSQKLLIITFEITFNGCRFHVKMLFSKAKKCKLNI